MTAKTDLEITACGDSGICFRRRSIVSFMKSKSELRQEIRAKLRAQPPANLQSAEGLLLNLERLQELNSLQSLAGYFAIGHEPDLRPFFLKWLQTGRALLFPRFNPVTAAYELAAVGNLERDTIQGRYGIPEPAPLLSSVTPSENIPQGWLIPGLAFAWNGSRLGRGAGYYDRLLDTSPGLKIGICFDQQLLPEIPIQEHDVPMDYIITESRIINCMQ